MPATKIVATIGPASESGEMIEKLIRGGVNVFRCNLKHGTKDWHKDVVHRIHEISQRLTIPIGILFDLQGPEIRTEEVAEGGLNLTAGMQVILTTEKKESDKPVIVIRNPWAIACLREGVEFSIDDGKFTFRVTQKENDYCIVAQVLHGGVLGSKKSVSIPNLPEDLPFLTDQDKEFLDLSRELHVDSLALSYVRRGNDIEKLKEEMIKRDITAQIIAKIETADAVTNFEEILAFSQGIMVARGDLGVEIPVEQVPYYQKHIIKRCVEEGKPVITATQMLESMIANPTPTRAEISDVANAMYDHTDAIMLSGETAAGKYPLESVQVMVKTAEFIEPHVKTPSQYTYKIKHQTDALLHAASEFAKEQDKAATSIKAFVVVSESGYAARTLSRYRLHLPIVAITPTEEVRNMLLFVFGVCPLLFPFTPDGTEEHHMTQIEEMLSKVKETGIVSSGDTVLMVYSSRWGRPGNNNVIRIEEVK